MLSSELRYRGRFLERYKFVCENIQSKKDINLLNAFLCGDIQEDQFLNHVTQNSISTNVEPLRDLIASIRFRTIQISVLIPLCALIIGLLICTNDVSILDIIENNSCLLDSNSILTELARPVEKCDYCSDLQDLPVFTNITQEEFQKYAYRGFPILILNATDKWAALKTFTYDYFKQLYLDNDEALQDVENFCQFFSYETDFLTLDDVFEMPKEEAENLDGNSSWYIGW